MLKFQVRKNETENQNGNAALPVTSNNAQIQVSEILAFHIKERVMIRVVVVSVTYFERKLIIWHLLFNFIFAHVCINEDVCVEYFFSSFSGTC